MTDPTPHLFWITSRTAGFVALVLASLAVSLGLVMSTKLLKGRTYELRVAHETLALGTIVAIVVHAVTLLGDAYFHPSIADITIPFVSDYKQPWMTIGIFSGWGLVLLSLSYYVRRTLGAVRWRKLHRFTALAWLAGLAHAIGEGTDAGQLWFLAMVAIVAIPALGLLAIRFLGSGASPGDAATDPPGGRGPVSAGNPSRPVPLRDLPVRGAVPPRSTVASGGAGPEPAYNRAGPEPAHNRAGPEPAYNPGG